MCDDYHWHDNDLRSELDKANIKIKSLQDQIESLKSLTWEVAASKDQVAKLLRHIDTDDSGNASPEYEHYSI